jgi:hypothetical protein
VSQTFQITWVGDRTRDWETDKGQFTAYKIALAGYDPSENDPEAGKTVEWSRRKDAQAPRPGDEVFGHVEAKQYDWGTKYVFKTDKAQDGGPPASFKKAGANGAGAPAPATQDSDWWYAKDRRISRAGVLQAVVAGGAYNDELPGGAYIDAVNDLTDALLASLDERTPHPSAPTDQQIDKAAGYAEQDERATAKPVIEDVTPEQAKAVLADDDSVPF